MKKLGLPGLALLMSASIGAHGENIWIEAETGAEYNPIVVKSDLGASEAIYLGSWKWADYTTRSKDDGMITYSVYVQQPGDYTLWARLRAPWDGAKPYDVSFGSGDTASASEWKSWAPDPRPVDAVKNWGWSNSGVTQYLAAGKHTFHMVQREGGPDVHLDKLLLTNEPSFVPVSYGTAEPTLDIENPYRSNTVEKFGQLKLVGNKLSDKNGNAVQLQGISAHGLQWFPLVENQTIPYMAEYFGAEAVRLAMYIEDYAPTDPSDFWGGYTANKALLLRRTEEAIDDAVKAGIYVLVDWHIHNTPAKYTAQATEFFNYISKKYGHLPNIIYEICNEPVSVSWSSGIKPYAQTIISTIRANDPDNIIIVGTPNWSQDVDAAAQDPLTGSNLMYAFHFYAATHDLNQMKNKVQTALNAGLAIFVSEWGSSDVGTSSSNLGVAQQWMEFMNQNKLSWINWSLGNKDESSSILKPTAPLSGPWVASDLTAPGAWLKPYFDAPAAATGSFASAAYSSVGAIASSVAYVAPSSAASSSVISVPTTLLRSLEGESYQVVAGEVKVEGPSLAFFDNGDKVMYSNVDFTGVEYLKIRYATQNSGTFELRLDSASGTKILSYNTSNTGSWSSYKEVIVSLLTPVTGVHNLYLLGVTGDGIMNLDKIEFLKTASSTASSSTAASSKAVVSSSSSIVAASVASSSVASSSVSSVVSSSVSSVASTSSSSVASSASSAAVSSSSVVAVSSSSKAPVKASVVNGAIEAEVYDEEVAGSVTPLSGALGLIDAGDVVIYRGVDLTGVTGMKFNYATSVGGTFELRVGSKTGTKLLTHNVVNTGDFVTYKEFSVSLSTTVSGTQDIYLVATSGSRIMNLDKIGLVKNITIEAERYNQNPIGSVQAMGSVLAYFDAGDVAVYYDIDMTGVKAIKLVYASGSSGNIEFHVDNQSGQQVMSTYINSTGGYANMAEMTVNLSSTVSGNRNLYLVGTSGVGIMNLDKIILIK